MNSRRAATLREMGLAPLWKLRRTEQQPLATQQAVAAQQPAEEQPAAAAPTAAAVDVAERAAAIAQMDWPQLARAVADCRACALCEGRQQAVLGSGDLHPDWLFVGEGPGAEEDRKGEPFVGQAGRLLDAMLAAIELERKRNVYIANTVKCRPPDNRTPEAEEIAACRPYLERQIELLAPKLIVALGKPATQTLLGREAKIGAERGKRHDYRGIHLIVTYHPAYLLRDPRQKKEAWTDLQIAMRELGLKPPGKE